jgi:glycosyl hydrolase family 115
VAVPVQNPASPRPSEVRGFVEHDGHVAIDAAHYTRAVAAEGVAWQQIPEHGRELSAVTTAPVTAPASEPGGACARLEYELYVFAAGERTLTLYVSPTLDCLPGRQLRCGVSFDDETPEVVDLLAGDSLQAWSRAVSDGVRQVSVNVELAQPGAHVLKLWRVDPAVVLQKIVLHGADLRPSYLGPPESPRGPLAEPVPEPAAEQE